MLGVACIEEYIRSSWFLFMIAFVKSMFYASNTCYLRENFMVLTILYVVASNVLLSRTRDFHMNISISVSVLIKGAGIMLMYL